jgi:hypothetical protein
MELDMFGPNICKRWNSQSYKLKDELINKLVGLFGAGSFNKYGVSSKACTYLKYLWDQYRVHIQKNPKYENPPMILEREWKALHEYEKEDMLRREGKTLPDLGRYVTLLIM